MQYSRVVRLTVLTTLIAVAGQRANAHFIYVTMGKHADKYEARLYFSESAQAKAERLPEPVAAADFWYVSPTGNATRLFGEKVERSAQPQLAAPLPTSKPCSIEAACRYGVCETFLLTYYAKHLNFGIPAERLEFVRAGKLALDFDAAPAGSGIKLTVFWQNQALPGTVLTLSDPRGRDTEVTTDAHGSVLIATPTAGLYAVRAQVVEEGAAGELDGKAYHTAHHCGTLTFDVRDPNQARSNVTTGLLPDLPEAVASFGAAVSEGWLYVYGGHIGKAHDHSKDNLSRRFRRIRLSGGAWQELPSQAPVQGLALIAHAGQIYRIGGMTARNAAGSAEDLHSTRDFARFDPPARKWTALPSLPVGRSSHDAVAIDDKIFVTGGWSLQGESEGNWQTRSLVFDLSQPDLGWQKLPEQPFARRALAAGHFNGKLYAIGGINAEHDIDRSVNVFAPETGKWTTGPDFPGEGMNGFGASAWNINGKLYASGSNGVLYRLSADGQRWVSVNTLQTARFFHRLLPALNGNLLAVGGASSLGHLKQIEQIRINRTPPDPTN